MAHKAKDIVTFDGDFYTFVRKLKSIDDTALVIHRNGYSRHVDYSSLVPFNPKLLTNKNMIHVLDINY